jgi:hypothetical protein
MNKETISVIDSEEINEQRELLYDTIIEKRLEKEFIKAVLKFWKILFK